MAFAVTKYKSYSIRPHQGICERFEHIVELHITAANTDTDCDIGDFSGTFWTAAEADATYGDIAENVADAMQDLYPNASCITWESPELDTDYVRVIGAPALAGEFKADQNSTTKIPDLTFLTTDAPTALTVRLRFSLKTGIWPVDDKAEGTGI